MLILEYSQQLYISEYAYRYHQRPHDSIRDSRLHPPPCTTRSETTIFSIYRRTTRGSHYLLPTLQINPAPMSSKQHDCDRNHAGRCHTLNEIPESQQTPFFPESGRYRGLDDRSRLKRWFFWKKHRREKMETNVPENEDDDEDRHDDEDRQDDEDAGDKIVVVLDEIYHTGKRVLFSPFTNLFRQEEDTEDRSTTTRAPPPLSRNNSSKLFDYVVPPPVRQSLWAKIYQTVIMEFGSMALMQNLSWVGHGFTFLWMILPTTIVAHIWHNVTGYFGRWSDAFANNFRLPYKKRDVGVDDGGGQWNYGILQIGAAAAIFVYQTQQAWATRRRRNKHHREEAHYPKWWRGHKEKET